MSGVAGGTRILKQDVQDTFNKYVDEVLRKIPGFKKASLSGSVKAGSKADFGDLDIIAWFEGEDKREVKQRIIQTVLSLPEKVIVPFPEKQEVEGPDGEVKTIGSNYPGKRYYNSGELISVLYPIVGKPGEFIQVDNIIALTEEESTFKEAFLDTPAEKQGLLMGLAKVILTEQDPQVVFERMGISNLPKLEKDEKYEFNLSSVGLTLRQVKKDHKQQVGKAKEPWSSSNWGAVRILFRGFNIDGSFEDLLDDIAKKLQSSDAKSRVVGIFKSMVTAKTGEIGKEKGIAKDAAREKVAQALSEALDEQSTIVALYAGGFKPPHLAHFENAKFLAGKADLLKIFIGRGKKKRLGIEITPEQSMAIWEIYAKYITTPVEVEISPISPITDTYEWVENNQSKVDKIITGAIASEIPSKFGSFLNKPELFPKVEIVELPVIEDKEDKKLSGEDTKGKKVSGTTIRTDKDYLVSGKWIPKVVSKEDKQTIIDIVAPQEEPAIEDKMLAAVDEVFEGFFPKKTKTIKEGSSGTAIVPGGAIPSKDRASLEHLYDNLKQTIDPDKYTIVFNQDRIDIYIKTYSDVSFDGTPYQKHLPEGVEQQKFNYTPYIGSIIEYMLDQGMNITPLPEVKLRYDENEANDFFGKTAYYDPNNKEVILYAMGRLPKDVCRSFAHEMIHHMQNIEGRLGNIQTTNTNEDDHLQQIEDEAYLEGNRVFRNWEDGIKNK